MSTIKTFSRWLTLRASQIKLPWFQGLSVYNVAVFFFKGIYEGRVTNRAASVAFSFFLALFPGIIFLFSLIPYFPFAGIEDEIFFTFQRILPPDTYEATKSTIDDVLNNRRSSLLSFGFLFALLFATNGVNSMISNFNDSYHQIDARSFWKQQLAAVSLTVVLSFLFLIGITIILFSSGVINSILSFFELERISPLLIESSRFLLLIMVVLLAIAILYNFGPAKRREWHFISPGSILATLLILISSFGFSYYVGNFAQYNKIYGSIGTLMVIMIWIYINALVLIIGFELNASIASLKLKQREKEEELELIRNA